MKNKENKQEKNVNKTAKTTHKRIEITDILIFLIIFIIFGFALLSFFPGLLTSDLVDQINQAKLNSYSNAHPILHSFLVGNLTKLGGIWVPALFQILVFAIIWTYSCRVLRKYNDSTKNKVFQIIFTLIICVIPLNFLYSITLWKDILYSYAILAVLIYIYIGIKENFKFNIPQTICIGISTVAIMKLRHNGVPIGFIMFAIFLIMNIVKNKKLKPAIGLITSFVAFFIIMSIPTWAVNVNQSSDNVSGVLDSTKVYCMGALLNTDIQLEKEEEDFLNTIIDIEKWKEYYSPYDGTTLLFSQDYHSDVLKTEEGQAKFNEIFMKYAKQKPLTLVVHLAKVNSIWWCIPEKGAMHSVIINNGSVSEMSNGIYDNHPITMTGNDKLGNYTIKTLENKLIYTLMYRPAVAILISFIAIIAVCVKDKKKEYLLILLPMILNIGTYVFLISSQDQRYFYPCFMTEYMSIIIFANMFLKPKRRIIKINEEKEKTKPLIIIPAYNEGQNIEKTVRDVIENTDYDYVVINDSSKDNTEEICKKNNFNIISLPINFGLTSGIQIGMKYAYKNGYNIAIQFDGDGQHQAKYLKKLVQEIEQGNCDVAIGSRFVTEKKPRTLRMLGSRLITLCIKMTTGQKIKDPTSGMRAYNKRAIKEFIDDSSLTPEPDTLVYMINRGMMVKEIQVQIKDREFGESYLKPFKAIEYMFNMIFSILFIRSLTEKDEEVK